MGHLIILGSLTRASSNDEHKGSLWRCNRPATNRGGLDQPKQIHRLGRAGVFHRLQEAQPLAAFGRCNRGRLAGEPPMLPTAICALMKPSVLPTECCAIQLAPEKRPLMESLDPHEFWGPSSR